MDVESVALKMRFPSKRLATLEASELLVDSAFVSKMNVERRLVLIFATAHIWTYMTISVAFIRGVPETSIADNPAPYICKRKPLDLLINAKILT